MTGKRAVGRATGDAEQTAQVLERAAVQLLERDGVLGGLNLREVADHAGVNRGLVYHYFGSRRELLRAALRREHAQRLAAARLPDEPRGIAARVRHTVRARIGFASTVRLLVLLILDGDKLPILPDRERTQELIRGDQADGHLDPELDPIGLHAMIQACSIGYVVARERLADGLDVTPEDLDERYLDVLGRVFAGVERTPGAAQG